jgi:hypothetical protein
MLHQRCPVGRAEHRSAFSDLVCLLDCPQVLSARAALAAGVALRLI